MTNPATTADLAARWRPLSAQETTNGTTFLDDTWRMLRRRFPTLEQQIAADTTGDLEDEVVRVQCAAVLRVMKNPDGLRQESVDDYTWTRDQAVSAGLLYFDEVELAALTADGTGPTGAFSIGLLGSGYPGSRFP